MDHLQEMPDHFVIQWNRTKLRCSTVTVGTHSLSTVVPVTVLVFYRVQLQPPKRLPNVKWLSLSKSSNKAKADSSNGLLLHRLCVNTHAVDSAST